MLGKRTSREVCQQAWGADRGDKRARFTEKVDLFDEADFFGCDESELEDNEMHLINFEPLGLIMPLQRQNAVVMLNIRHKSLYI